MSHISHRFSISSPGQISHQISSEIIVFMLKSVFFFSLLVSLAGWSKYFWISLSWNLSRSVFDIFPFASRVPLLYLQTVVGDVVRTLKVMYGSLDRLVSLSFPVVLLRELEGIFFAWCKMYWKWKVSFSKAPPGFHTLSSLSYYFNPLYFALKYILLHLFFLKCNLCSSVNYFCVIRTLISFFSSAAPFVRWTMCPGWTISSACSSSSSFSHLA